MSFAGNVNGRSYLIRHESEAASWSTTAPARPSETSADVLHPSVLGERTFAASEHHVAYVPGQMSFPIGDARQTCRLSFATANAQRIDEGILALGEFVSELGQWHVMLIGFDRVESEQ